MTASTLHEALAAQVTATPDRVAVSAPDGTLTYRQLAERSDALAGRLRQAGVAAGDLVVLSTGRGLEMIVGLVAIAKSGAAYLPVDPGVPEARLRWLVEQGGAVLTLTDGSTAAGSGPEVMLVAGGRADPTVVRSGAARTAAGGPDPLAYVIYTSGSTGEPKGVAVSHRNVLALLEQTEELFRFTAEDVWTVFHSIAFDFSVWEIWGSLLHGGRLVVVAEDVARSPAAFGRLLARERVTVLNQTPSAFLPLVATGTAAELPDLRLVILGGERVSMPALRPWLERHGDQRPRLVNMYGITEGTVFSSYRPITLADLDRPELSPIGVPLPRNRFLVLDEDGRPVADGEPGELYLLGPTVAAGYLGAPESARERFAPCAQAGGERAYRTGDRVVRQPDGDHCFLGRADRQLKVRGYRVDPVEVERHLQALELVGAAAVTARDYGGGDVRLVAHLVPPPGQADEPAWREQAIGQARQRLAEALPASLCPSVYETRQTLPLTANGKADLAALSASYQSSDQTSDATDNGTPAGQIAAIWRSVLDTDDFGTDDDFFDLGGTSLTLIRMFEQVNDNFGLRMDVQVLLDGVTVTALSSAVEAASQGTSSPLSEMAVE